MQSMIIALGCLPDIIVKILLLMTLHTLVTGHGKIRLIEPSPLLVSFHSYGRCYEGCWGKHVTLTVSPI